MNVKNEIKVKKNNVFSRKVKERRISKELQVNLSNCNMDSKRKVYSILSLQLLVTIAVVMGIFFIKPVKLYMRTDGQWMFWLAFVTEFVCIFPRNSLRKTLGNLIWLGVFTLGKSSHFQFLYQNEISNIWHFFLAQGIILGYFMTIFRAYGILIDVGMMVAVVFHFKEFLNMSFRVASKSFSKRNWW